MSTKTTYILIALVLVIFWSGLIWLSSQLATKEARIDCSMAEFHPDYTPEIRKQCRELMRHKL